MARSKSKQKVKRHRHKLRRLRALAVAQPGELAGTQRQVARACELKDELAHFWTYRYIGSAEKFLKGWKKRAKLSRIETDYFS